MFGDFGKMIRIAADVKRRMPEVQARLESSEFSADSGGGAVRATVNGKLRLLDVKIDRSVHNGGALDLEMLEDLVKAAVSAAQKKAADAAVAAMQELTGGMNIPGMADMI